MTSNRVAYSGAVPEVVELAELVAARVYNEPLVHCVNFPTNHPLFQGNLSPSKVEEVSLSSDVVLAAGCKLFEDVLLPTASLPPDGAKVIQLDINPWEIAKNYPVEVAVVADLKSGLRELIVEVSNLVGSRQQSIRERIEHIGALKENARAALEREFKKDWDATPIRAWRVMKELRSLLPQESILIDESVTNRHYV